MWPSSRPKIAMLITGYIGPMSRGERPRKVKDHWIQDVVAENLKSAMAKDGRSPAQLGAAAKVGRKSVERLAKGENATGSGPI
jgi:hypothetical protein